MPVGAFAVAGLHLRAGDKLGGTLHQVHGPFVVILQRGLNLQAGLAVIVHVRDAQLHERRASGTTRVAGVLQLLGTGVW